jgi:hypothetical protein
LVQHILHLRNLLRLCFDCLTALKFFFTHSAYSQ